MEEDTQEQVQGLGLQVTGQQEIQQAKQPLNNQYQVQTDFWDLLAIGRHPLMDFGTTYEV